jgi:hypothetical protein
MTIGLDDLELAGRALAVQPNAVSAVAGSAGTPRPAHHARNAAKSAV